MLAALAVALVGTSAAADWTQTTLYNFDAAKGDGGPSWADVTADSAGALYGVGLGLVDVHFGTVFKLTPKAKGPWKHTMLHRFAGGALGSSPTAGLLLRNDNEIYGTTARGGDNGAGTVFQLKNTNGRWKLKILHSFDVAAGEAYGNSGDLAMDQDGNLYGTTTASDFNPPGKGIAYQVRPPAGGTGKWKFKVLHRFTGGPGGANPDAGMALGPDGDLYGTTAGISFDDPGTIFQLQPQPNGVWKHKVLYRFENWNNGRGPRGNLLRDEDGSLYGTTFGGGLEACSPTCGVVFRLSPSGQSWQYAVLHRFRTIPDDGFNPVSGVILRTGALYGVTQRGGTAGKGVVYKLEPRTGPTWKETILHNFAGAPDEGAVPRGGLFFRGGIFYGTTSDDGSADRGTVFKIGH